MSFTLRPYQAKAVEAAMRAFTKGKPFIIQAATGAGKSLIIADVAHKLGEPVLVLQPSLELLQQNQAKMLSYGLDVSVYSASAGEKNLGGTVVMATIGSIKDYELFKRFHYIIVDEADVVNPKTMTGMYQKLFTAIGCTNICGLTATPYRVETKYVYKGHDLYAAAALKMITRIGKPTFWAGGIVYKIETLELINAGYLSPITYRADTDDFRELVVNSTGADYTTESLESWAATKADRITEYCAYVEDKCQRNLVFCTSVHQARATQGLLAKRGIKAAIVTADTPTKERADLVGAFKNGTTKHMLNVGVFLAGFDVPELDSIIFARPTLSPRVWYQAVGRGVRLDPARPDKTLRVFDLGGALRRIGRVESLQIAKDADGFRDALWSETGRLDERPLWKFRIQRKNYR